jgi:FkbM family methyltransferase
VRRELSDPAVAILRWTSKRMPLPGWFALVVEPIYRRLGRGNHVEVQAPGGRMVLDLCDYNQRRIYFHSHERSETLLLRRLLRKGDVVVDVGANVGFFTLLAATLVGADGEVHAFEPVPANYAMLEQNVRLNGHAQVRLVAAAAGNANGTISLGIPVGITSDAGETSGNFTVGGAGRSVEAPMVVLDEYLDVLGGRRARLVKIDVEGVEPQVLAGLGQTLDAAPPDVFLVEVNRIRLAEHGYEPEDVVGPLTGRGYRVYRVGFNGRLRRISERDRRRSLFNVLALRPGLGDGALYVR